MYIIGSGRIIYLISLIVMFDADITNVGWDNVFVIRFKFFGGGELEITVHYTDGTSDDYDESQQSTYLTKGYGIDDYKIVSYISFVSNEWWNPGYLYLDLVIVGY